MGLEVGLRQNHSEDSHTIRQSLLNVHSGSCRVAEDLKELASQFANHGGISVVAVLNEIAEETCCI